MHSVFFSIIIPTFNSGKILSACLASVLGQTFGDFEILVIDGCSDDNTLSIAERTAEESYKVRWISEKDSGIYDAMNKGVNLAKGEWLFFLGSDDVFFDDTVLSEIKNAIDLAPKTRFIYGDVFTSAGYVQKFDHFSFPKLTEKNICHQAIFYHASLFRDLHYDISLRLLADWDFNLKVFREQNSPTYINRVIAVYNLNGGSAGWLMGEEYKRHFQDRKALFLKHMGHLAYYRFRMNEGLWRIKRRVKEALSKVRLSPAGKGSRLL